MSATRVAVIGGGICGPVMAMLLKLKGYDPVIYERLPAIQDRGLGIGFQVNGLEVVSKIPGLLDYLGGCPRDGWQFYSVLPEDKGFLGSMLHPKREGLASGAIAFRRHIVQERLNQFAEKSGIAVNWGHDLDTLEQDEDGVNVTFANGVKERFSFVIGCDGIHSSTRKNLFGDQPADYTGTATWAGVSPATEEYRGTAASRQIYGNGSSIIMIPLADDTIMWATTVLEPEAKENWRALDETTANEFKNSNFVDWDFGVGDMVRNSTKIIRFGLYDRPELPTWHKGRVVIIGDAAHPTSPHLGQGANQAFEDANLLVELLQKYNPSNGSPSTATLDIIFSELEKVRIPRTAELVKRARMQGQLLVVQGVEACISRNNQVRALCNDPEGHSKRFGV